MSLVGEMTLSEGLPLFGVTYERVPDAESILEDVHYLTTDEGEFYYVLFSWDGGCAFEELDRALEADPTVRKFRTLTELDERRLTRIVTTPLPPEQKTLFPALRTHDGTSIETRRDSDGIHVRVRFPDRETLAAFVEDAREIADTVDVTGLYAETGAPFEEDSLTAKQRTALSLAVGRGYFDTPSRVTLEELSEETDVTPQTLSKHIRIGVKKLVEDAVEPATDEESREII